MTTATTGVGTTGRPAALRRGLKLAVYVGLALLALGAFWWRLRTPPTAAPSPAAVASRTATGAAPPADADARYTLEKVVVVRFNARGEPYYRATADRLRQFPDASTRLDRLDVTGLGGRESGWSLSAERGDMPAGGHVVALSPGVIVHGVLDGTGPVTLLTERVQVDFDKRMVTSRQPVRLSAANHSAEAEGGFTTGFDGRSLDLDGPVTLFYGGQKIGGTTR